MDSPFVGGSMEYSKRQELVNYHIGLAWDGMKGWWDDRMFCSLNVRQRAQRSQRSQFWKKSEVILWVFAGLGSNCGVESPHVSNISWIWVLVQYDFWQICWSFDVTKLLWFLFGGIFGIDHSLVNTLPGRNKSRCPDNGKKTTAQSANFHFQAPVICCWKCSHVVDVVVCQSNIAGLKTDQKMGDVFLGTKCERCTVDGSEIRLLTSWGNGSLFHYLQGFIHPQWLFGISFFLSTVLWEDSEDYPPKISLEAATLELDSRYCTGGTIQVSHGQKTRGPLLSVSHPGCLIGILITFHHTGCLV